MKQSGFTREELAVFIKSQLVALLGCAAAGLGGYGLVISGQPLHPLLAGRSFNIALLCVGGLFFITEWFMLWPLLKARQRRAQQAGDGT